MSLILDGTAGVTFPNGNNPQAAPSKVLQVVSNVLTTQTSSTSSTFSDTGLSVTITPLFSTSKILIFVDHAGCYNGSGGTILGLQLLRNSTAICYFEGFGGYTASVSQSEFGSCSTNYLDSPATTSATTYKTQLRNINATSTVSIGYGPCTSTITVMEIAQ
jgi:hypothetical protein